MKQPLTIDPCNTIITGVGGQGNVLIAQLFGKALTNEGFSVTVGDTYGAAQRGGPVSSHIRISEKNIYSPLTPSGKAHLIVSLEPVEALRIIGTYGNPNVIVISNTRPSYPFDVTSGGAYYPNLDEIKAAALQLSKRAIFLDVSAIALDLGSAVMTNVVMSGVVMGTGLLPLRGEVFLEVLKDQFAGKRQDQNLKAFERGMEMGKLHWSAA
jgi:indolepyruvate ferredoxin oxidoreductase, beta subunit